MQGWLGGVVLAGFLAASQLCCGIALAGDPSPFDRLAGRWLGEGRFGTRNGNTEAVKCRVAYVLSGTSHDDLKQTIRCAAASGSIEVQSQVSHIAGKLSGTWKELTRDMSGDLSGDVTSNGFRVAVRGASLRANMTIIMVSDVKQVVEIQFMDSALIGLRLILEKG